MTLDLLPIKCSEPAKRWSTRCEINDGIVEITKDAPVALVGPLTYPVFIIPCETAQFSISGNDHQNTSIKLSPFRLLALSRGLERVASSSAAEVIMIALNPSSVHDNLLSPEGRPFEKYDSDIHTISRILRNHVISSDSPSDRYVEACVSLIRFHVSQLISRDVARLQQSEIIGNEWDNVLAWIDERLDQSITVAEISKQFGFSASQFSHLFKNAIGHPPHEYIRNRKLQRARELLITTSDSLAEIALASGYCSQAHMTSTFSRLLGTSPARFRNKHPDQ